MDGISISGRMLRAPKIRVKSEPAGVCISCEDDRDPTQWVHVYITTGALWALVNQQEDGGEFILPAVPPFVPDEIDLGEPPPAAPVVTLPPVPPVPRVPPFPPRV